MQCKQRLGSIMPPRARLTGLCLYFVLLLYRVNGVELNLTSGRDFVLLMRSLSGPLNLTLQIPPGVPVINASEGLPLPPIVGPGFADSGTLRILGPNEGPRPVLDLHHLRDVSVRAAEGVAAWAWGGRIRYASMAMGGSAAASMPQTHACNTNQPLPCSQP